MKKNNIKHGKRNFGIFFIILQITSIYGSTMEENTFQFKNIFEMIGFFSFGIIGILLIINDYLQNKNK